MNKINGKYKKITDREDKLVTLARHGYDETETAEMLGISAALLTEFLKKNSDLWQILRNAKNEADIEVEQALFRKATGYETIEEHTVYIPVTSENNDPEEFRLKEFKKVKKQVPPDTTSALTWLFNRRSLKWSKNPAAQNELNNSESLSLKKLAYLATRENM